MNGGNHMKKKVARVLFAFVLILAMIPLTASAESSADTEDNEVTEQFDLATGETYYFDLTCLGNATGTVNDSLPDKTLHYVPVTYVGTVDAYRLPEYTWPMDRDYGESHKYEHSLFIADYNIKYRVSWIQLANDLKYTDGNHTLNGVEYGIRTPSGRSQSYNEWDQILNKNESYIKNWKEYLSWTNDPGSAKDDRTLRGGSNGIRHNFTFPYNDTSPGNIKILGFRPVMEIVDTSSMTKDALKPVRLDLNGSSMNGKSSITIVVRNGRSFDAPASEGIEEPTTDQVFAGWSDGSKIYKPGDSVPADVTSLTAQWKKRAPHVHCICGGDVTLSDEHKTHSDVSFQPWRGTKSISYDDDGTAYRYLLDDATINRDLVINGKTLYLCLNGRKFACDNTHTIKVRNGGRLVICDCHDTGSIKGVYNNSSYGSIQLFRSTLDIYGGTITGSTARCGGGIALEDSECVFNMYGGSITGNRAIGYSNEPPKGGAIFVKNGGTLNLYGGQISNNKTTNSSSGSFGGAVYMSGNGTVNLHGTDFTGNSTGGSGGAVYFDGDGTLNLCGGTITSNTAVTKGGGICAGSNTVLNISGGKVWGNIADGSSDNICLADGNIISLGNLKSDTVIGIMTEYKTYPLIFSDASDKDLSEHFFADDAKNAHVAFNSEKKLELARGSEDQHPVIIDSANGGTASVSSVKNKAGENVTLTASASEDCHFREWQVISGDIDIKDNKFMMPDDTVRVKAVFEKHTAKTTKTPATLSKAGVEISACSVCGKELNKTEIAKISRVTLSTSEYTYNGAVRSPSVTVKDSAGKTISSSCYTVKKSTGRKNVGRYTYTITFRGDYSGSRTLSFVIKPKGTGISSLKARSKGFKVTWKKQKTQTAGYQIQYSTSKKFSKTKTVTVKKISTVSKNVSKLKARKKYYVRVRTYQTFGSAKYYSGWSSAKSVKTK